MKLNPTIKYFAHLWLQFKESLAVLIALNAYLSTYCNNIIVCILLACVHGMDIIIKGCLKV